MTLPIAILLGLLLLGLLVIGLPPALWLLARTVINRIEATWGGHTIAIVERPFGAEMWVDDERVATGRRDRLEGSLVDVSLGPIPVVFARDLDQHALCVAGERISGDLVATEAAAATRVAEPTDARWPAAKSLLDSLGEQTDPEVRNATMTVGVGLRDALHHLAVLEATAKAHSDLGGQGELAEARETLDAEVDRWIEALRALHLQSTVRAGSPADALAQIRAEGEVDAAVRRRARALAERAGQG